MVPSSVPITKEGPREGFQIEKGSMLGGVPDWRPVRPCVPADGDGIA